MSDSPEPATSARDALLEDGLLVLFRIKNSRVDYSLMNRPEPTLTGLNDHLLATAIIEAGQSFDFQRMKGSGREVIQRDDGRSVTYKEQIDIDWEDKVIKGTKGKDLTLQVLSIVVQNLMADAMREHDRKNPHGAN